MLPNASPNLPVPPQGAMPQEGGGEQVNPEELKSMLVQVIDRVRQLAEQNGIDFNELVNSSGGMPSPSPEMSMGGGAPVPSGMPTGAPPMM